jgi:class 3 adenylate cyclase
MSLANGPAPTLGRVLRAHKQEIVLVNDTGREQLIRLERTSPRDDVLTAARASAHALFRQLFPNEVLEPGALVRVASLVLLYADVRGTLTGDLTDPSTFSTLYSIYKSIEAEVSKAGGSVVKLMGDGVLAVFHEPSTALRAAMTLEAAATLVSPSARVHVAVHRGPAAAVTLNDRLDYFGKSVTLVTALARDRFAGRVVVSDELLTDPVVQEILDERARAKALRLANSDEQTGPLAIT